MSARRRHDWLVRGARPLGGDAADLLLRDGVIAEIGPAGTLDAAGAQVVDADGLVALPGLVDLHTHLREPGREDAETVETGTRAAALGGFTAVHAMANTDPVADTAGVVEQVWRLGREAGPLRRAAGRRGHRRARPAQQLAELGAMADSAARVRVFSDDGHCVSDAVLMRRALEYVKAFDGVVAQHAQEPRLTEGAQMNEGDAVRRSSACRAGRRSPRRRSSRATCCSPQHVGSRLHVCHVSTAGSVELIRWAKARGVDVTAEVTPHHLLLTDELATTYDPVYKVNPPLRTKADVEALRAAWPTAPSTPSPPTTPRTRSRTRTASGPRPRSACSGCETALSASSPRRWSRPGCSTGPASPTGCRCARPGSAGSRARPAARGGRAGQPGAGRPGRASWTVEPTALASKSRNTPFAGRELPASVVATFLRGRPDRSCDGSAGVSAAPAPALLVLEDGRTFRGEALRRARRDVRRGGLLHRR